jgi:hypothetical protein
MAVDVDSLKHTFMVSLSNHEDLARTAVRRFMVRQAHHEAVDVTPLGLSAQPTYPGAAR